MCLKSVTVPYVGSVSHSADETEYIYNQSSLCLLTDQPPDVTPSVPVPPHCLGSFQMAYS